MTKRLESNVIPLRKDKFYVYALFKPTDFNPFYVGKGKGERVNDHFKASNLKKNTPKTGIIKKYGNKIKREILAYFDCEKTAYEFEEYLIALYGLESEGGYLANYAKTRFEYSERFVSEISAVGHLSRERKYSREVILEVLESFYIKRENKKAICTNNNISEDYIGYVLRGVKCKKDFLDFLQDKKLSKEDCEVIYRNASIGNKQIGRKRVQKVSDEDIVNSFDLFCSSSTTLEQLADKFNVSVKYFDAIFRVVDRSNLKIDHAKYKKIVNTRSKFTKAVKTGVVDLIVGGMSCSEVMKRTGISRTSFYRIKKRTDNAA